jgi:hypothetical protein
VSENVPPLDLRQTVAAQGVARSGDSPVAERLSAEMSPNVPVCGKNVPPSVPLGARIEAVAIGPYYVAAYRREGCADVLLDGPDGKPERFASAFDAVKAAKLALVFKPTVIEREHDLGARHHHEVRAAQHAALQIETLGGVVVDGRVVPVEVRRR